RLPNLLQIAPSPAIVDRHVAADHPAQPSQRLQKRRIARLGLRIVRRQVHEKADAPHPLSLLRPRDDRPCGCCAPENLDKLASLHSITSSASASNVAGTVSPSALAVRRLITNSNFVPWMTGRSPGFAPARMRPV